MSDVSSKGERTIETCTSIELIEHDLICHFESVQCLWKLFENEQFSCK